MDHTRGRKRNIGVARNFQVSFPTRVEDVNFPPSMLPSRPDLQSPKHLVSGVELPSAYLSVPHSPLGQAPLEILARFHVSGLVCTESNTFLRFACPWARVDRFGLTNLRTYAWMT